MFYLVIMQNDQTQAVYRYDNYDEALAAFHSELAYRADNRTKTACAILNGYGDMIKHEYWIRESKSEEGAE